MTEYLTMLKMFALFGCLLYTWEGGWYLGYHFAREQRTEHSGKLIRKKQTGRAGNGTERLRKWHEKREEIGEMGVERERGCKRNEKMILPPGIRNWLAGRSGQLAARAGREMNAGSVIRIAPRWYFPELGNWMMNEMIWFIQEISKNCNGNSSRVCLVDQTFKHPSKL